MVGMSISRRSFLTTLGTTALAPRLVSGMPALLSKSGAAKPNVLFIAVDDLRPQLKCYGHSRMISPHIDSLAESGVLFERAYCQVPVCGASRASLLTGLRPTRSRFLDYYSNACNDASLEQSLPEHFQKNGYYTASYGKVFHQRDCPGAWDVEELPGSAGWRDYYQASGRPFWEAPDAADNVYAGGKVTDKAIAELERAKNRDKPTFLAVGFYKPHLPFNAPKKYWDQYKPGNIDLADNPFSPEHCPPVALHNWGELRDYDDIPGNGPLDEQTARKLIHGYYACVTYTDAQIGRILDELDNRGMRENTVIVVWGDHGWQLGEHGLWCKHSNFETSLHSPLIVNAPGISGGKRTAALTEFVDIFPSLCDLCGVSKPPHLEGTSFVPLLSNPSQPWKEAVLSRYRDGDSIRTDRYRYTTYTETGGGQIGRMLYDHDNDPGENTNIAGFEENAGIVDEMERKLSLGWEHFVPTETTAVSPVRGNAAPRFLSGDREKDPSGHFSLNGRRLESNSAARHVPGVLFQKVKKQIPGRCNPLHY